MPQLSDLVRPQSNPQQGTVGDLIAPMTWQQTFTHIAGYAPETVGVSDENAAQKYLLMLQAMHNAPSGSSDVSPEAASELTFGRAGQRTGSRPTR